jgi:hypothetical protein
MPLFLFSRRTAAGIVGDSTRPVLWGPAYSHILGTLFQAELQIASPYWVYWLSSQ